MRRFARLISDHPGWIVGSLAFLTILALHGIVDLRTGTLRLKVDPSVERLLPEGDEERSFYDHARQLFGSDEFILLLLDSGDAFAVDALHRVGRITQRVEKEIPGVHRVLSVANATSIEGAEDGGLYVGPFYEAVPHDPVAREKLRERLLMHPIYRGSLVTTDGSGAAVLVSFDRLSDQQLIEQRLIERVLQIADEERGEAKVFITGSPYIKTVMSQTILGEMSYVLPVILALAALLSFAAFRTLRGVVLPVATIGLAVVWTLGLMGWTNSPINLVSNMVPPLIITLGFAAAMHVVSEYYEQLHHHPAEDRGSHRAGIRVVIEEMGLAVLVNGLTTALGFASLSVSSVIAIQQFSLWSVVGVLATTLAALTFLPAMLSLLGPAVRLPRRPGEGGVDRIAAALAELDVRHRKWIFTGAFAALIVAVYGATSIRISTEYVTSFRPDAPVRRDFDVINERLGGAASLFVVVEGDEDGAFAEPENLLALRELQDWLEQQPEIGKTSSIADNVMLLNHAFQGNAPSALSIPDRMRLVKQLLLFGGDDVTRGFVDARLRVANVNVRSKVNDSEPVANLLERIDARLAELPKRLQAQVTGDLVLLNKTVDEVARGQLESVLVALITIYLVLSALLTSFRIGAMAFLPNLLPIAIFYGALGFSDIPLSLTTSLVAEIALGIAVDDTVHYFTRFNLEARRVGNEHQATVSTLRAVIRPVTFTTIGLCVGFLVLTFSELQSQADFAILAAFTLFVAWGLELTLSPALCSSVRLVTLWDLLALDLGVDPQRSIPLFHGLSTRQARVFVLMSNLVHSTAGERLLREGEEASDMYVVIDGALAASTNQGGERIEFGRMRRGDTVGEVAMFAAKRSADVDVVEDARLLRFDDGDLDRLGRRYPRIAAKVYRNLNRILAERVLNTARALR